VINQRVERAKRHAGAVAALHPNVKELTEKSGQLTGIELQAALDLLGGAARKRCVDLEVVEAKVLCEIPVEPSLRQLPDLLDVAPQLRQFLFLPLAPREAFGSRVWL